jgi:hypothetical protein
MIKIEKCELRRPGNQMLSISQDIDQRGSVWHIKAKAVDPLLGLVCISASRFPPLAESVRAEFAIGGVDVEMYLELDINITHRPTFARQFNRDVRPVLVAKAKELGLIGSQKRGA